MRNKYLWRQVKCTQRAWNVANVRAPSAAGPIQASGNPVTGRTAELSGKLLSRLAAGAPRHVLWMPGSRLGTLGGEGIREGIRLVTMAAARTGARSTPMTI